MSNGRKQGDVYLTDIHSQWRIDFQDLDNVVLEGSNHGLVNDEQDEFQVEEDEGNRLVSPIPSIRVASVSFPTEHPPRSEQVKMINTIQKDIVVSDAADRSRK